MNRAKSIHGIIARSASRVACTGKNGSISSVPATSQAIVSHIGGKSSQQSRYFHPSSQTQGLALLDTEVAKEGVIFPNEAPGVNYALNWSIASSGVSPSKEAFRNLKPEVLKQHGATAIGKTRGTKTLVKGTSDLTNSAFNKLFKEATVHLSASDRLYVLDAAIGSAPASDARTRVITDSASANLALREILSPAGGRKLDASLFPVTVYVVTPPGASQPPLIAVDPVSSTVLIIGEKALGDAGAVTASLARAAELVSFKKGALPLAGSLVSPLSLVLSPSTLPVPGAENLIWNAAGISRTFRKPGSKPEPNLLEHPKSIFLLTKDSTGALPPVLKLTPSQAAYYFLIGYTGDSFLPALKGDLSVLSPKESALRFKEIVESSGAQVFLVNSSEVSDMKALVADAANNKLPSGKQPSEGAVTALVSKFDEFVKSKFEELPEGISL